MLERLPHSNSRGDLRFIDGRGVQEQSAGHRREQRPTGPAQSGEVGAPLTTAAPTALKSDPPKGEDVAFLARFLKVTRNGIENMPPRALLASGDARLTRVVVCAVGNRLPR